MDQAEKRLFLIGRLLEEQPRYRNVEIYCASSHPFAPHSRYNAYIASSEPVYRYDGHLARFCGTDSTLTRLDASARALFQHPETVLTGHDCFLKE